MDQNNLQTQTPPVQNPITSENKNKKVEQSLSEKFRKYIEIEVLKIIKDLADKGKVTQDKMQAMAQLTLDLIKPGMTLEELFQNVMKLDDQYSELSPIVYKIMKEYEEKYGKKTIDEVSQLIKTENYDQAQEMVKKLLQFKSTG